MASDELEQCRQRLGGVAADGNRQRTSFFAGDVAPPHRRIQRVGDLVDVPGVEATLNTSWVHIDAERNAATHGHGERLRAAHAAEPRGHHQAAAQAAAETLAGHRFEGLERALEDALGADVDPRARGHLPIHRQPHRLEAPELLPRRPAWHQERVGDEHSWGQLVGPGNAHRLARLHQQGLVVAQRPERRDDGVEALPRASRPPGAAIHHQRIGVLRHCGVEVVHEAA